MSTTETKENALFPEYIEVFGRIGYSNEMNGIYRKSPDLWHDHPQWRQINFDGTEMQQYFCIRRDHDTGIWIFDWIEIPEWERYNAYIHWDDNTTAQSPLQCSKQWKWYNPTTSTYVIDPAIAIQEKPTTEYKKLQTAYGSVPGVFDELKQRVAELERQNESLQTALAQHQQADTKGFKRHSNEFWDTVKGNSKDPEYVKKLLKDKEIRVNDANSTGETLLIYAAIMGHYETAQLLINMGADIQQTDDKGQTAIDHAIEWNQHHIQRLLLLNSMDANVGNRIEETSYDLKMQNGIISNIVNTLADYDSTTRPFFQNTMIDIMIKVIEKKLAFSDQLLNLCWQFIIDNGEDPLQSQLWKTLQETCASIIESGDKRDWFYFKTFINPSLIWYSKVQPNEEKTDGDEDGAVYLYYKLFGLVSGESQSQTQELKNGIDRLAEQNKASWDSLVKWDIPDGEMKPRQDAIPNGVVSRYSKIEILSQQISTNFVPAKFCDYNQYLSQLVLLAQTVDDSFQKSVQQIFEIDDVTNLGSIELIGEEKGSGDGVIEYMRGPLKQLSRARSKAENDYAKEEWPTSACILDFNRCSLVFNDIATMLAAIDLFVNKVEYYKSGNVIGIVRDKNGFIDFVKETQYADIKLNVLLKGDKNNIIGEVQFLLRTMMDYKNKAHNLYAITREREYVENCVSAVLPILMDPDKELFIAGSMGDTKALCRLMTISNATQAEIMKADNTNDTILSNICYIGHLKAFKFVKNVLDTQLFLDRMFMKSVYIQNPIDYAIVSSAGGPQKRIIEIIFKDANVLQRFESDDYMTATVCFWTLQNCVDIKLIKFIFGALGMGNEKFQKLFDQIEDRGVTATVAIQGNETAQKALQDLGLVWQ